MSCPISYQLLPPELERPVKILTGAGIEHPHQEALDLYQWSQTQPGSPHVRTQIFQSALAERAAHKPFAYIVGMQPFYHLELIVNQHVLIPRAETEQLVSQVIEKVQREYNDGPNTLVDIGTGSGAIALALKHHLPSATVIGIDISEPALTCARDNAEKYKLDIQWRQGNLLEPLEDTRIDGLIANLPYLPMSMSSQLAPELHHEPTDALFSEDEGLLLIKNLIVQLKHRAVPIRWVWLEMLPMQIQTISEFIKNYLPTGQIRVITTYDQQARFIEITFE